MNTIKSEEQIIWHHSFKLIRQKGAAHSHCQQAWKAALKFRSHEQNWPRPFPEQPEFIIQHNHHTPTSLPVKLGGQFLSSLQSTARERGWVLGIKGHTGQQGDRRQVVCSPRWAVSKDIKGWILLDTVLFTAKAKGFPVRQKQQWSHKLSQRLNKSSAGISGLLCLHSPYSPTLWANDPLISKRNQNSVLLPLGMFFLQWMSRAWKPPVFCCSKGPTPPCSPGEATCSRCPSCGCRVTLYCSWEASLSWSAAESWRVEIVFAEFSSNTSPLLVMMEGGDLSSGRVKHKAELGDSHAPSLRYLCSSRRQHTCKCFDNSKPGTLGLAINQGW